MKKLVMSRVRKIAFYLSVAVVFAFASMYVIEWRTLDCTFFQTTQYIFENIHIFLYNVMLLLFLEVIIMSIFKSPWTGAGLTFVLSSIIGYITNQKQAFRGQPLMPEDFSLADQTGTIIQFINFGSLIRFIISIILTIILIVILNRLTKKFIIKKRSHVLRISCVVVSIFAFVLSTNFVRDHAGQNYSDNFLGTQFVAWNQNENYYNNGFILGFVYNLSKFKLSEPENYSEAKINEVKAEYGKTEYGKKKITDADYNIITILDESFYDPSAISEYYPIHKNSSLEKDSMDAPVTDNVIPTIEKMDKTSATSKRYKTGRMRSGEYGGGTANVEFEVDTSMSTFYAASMPFVDLIPYQNSVPSIAQIAKSAGYKTIAIHPFNGGMYKRNVTLKKEGIDEFIDESKISFKDQDDHRQYINDRSVYKEALKTLKGTDNKTFLSLITMQNHASYNGGYSTTSYELEDAPKSGKDISQFTDEEKMHIQTYLESLHNSDYYLSEFLSELEKMDEKTVVLFYGDHAPGIFGRLSGNDISDDVVEKTHLTPYFIWANFDLENTEMAHLETTTPNCLVPTLFNVLNLEKTEYLKLASAVCKEQPVLTRTRKIDEKTLEKDVLKSYELYIYDTLGGKQYWQK